MIAQEFLAPGVEWYHLSPIIALISGALFLLVVGALTPTWPRGGYALVTVLTVVVAGVLAWAQWDDVTGNGPRLLVGGALAFDAFALFLTIAICGATLLVALVSDDELRRSGDQAPEVYALMLVAATGGVVMAAANDLIVLFLGLETLSLALYVLAASDLKRPTSQEAGLKYFILGGFASAVFLYGIALVYGGAGSTNISEIVDAFQGAILTDGNDSMVLAGIALLIVGLGFKVAAVPFHVWTPDVYQGAPNHVTGFMASVGKAAAFGAMVRVLVVALPAHRDDWRPVVWVLALLSLVVGSLLAVVQTDVKRMLAYSSISHAGFILVGMEAAGHTAGTPFGAGIASVATYLPLYSVLTVGSFAVVALVARSNGGDTSLDAFAGLTVFLLAQAGVPFTSGFVAKWGVIQAAVEEESYAIAIIAMVSAVVAAFLYLRIMVKTWLDDGDERTGREAVPVSSGVAVALAAAFTLFVGVWPSWILDAADHVAFYAR
jgi:NADH-quinone oxidoreductase subunit N